MSWRQCHRSAIVRDETKRSVKWELWSAISDNNSLFHYLKQLKARYGSLFYFSVQRTDSQRSCAISCIVITVWKELTACTNLLECNSELIGSIDLSFHFCSKHKFRCSTLFNASENSFQLCDFELVCNLQAGHSLYNCALHYCEDDPVFSHNCSKCLWS